jgi:hypothetical protein
MRIEITIGRGERRRDKKKEVEGKKGESISRTNNE